MAQARIASHVIILLLQIERTSSKLGIPRGKLTSPCMRAKHHKCPYRKSFKKNLQEAASFGLTISDSRESLKAERAKPTMEDL